GEARLVDGLRHQDLQQGMTLEAALRLLLAARRRLFGLQSENRKLQRKIEDIRIIDRAKCLLIELRGMTEPEAHAYIEKQAMARRMTRRDIAQDILQIEAF
ncbi:MAG: ANTAR domain-containing protein, partial [Clostridia bacterium]|nr:ANTAR domain-containing protein [Clostridia bacterium]